MADSTPRRPVQPRATRQPEETTQRERPGQLEQAEQAEQPGRSGDHEAGQGAVPQPAAQSHPPAVVDSSAPIEPEPGGFLAEALAPAAGFGVSFSTMFKKVSTVQYPEERIPTAPRFHGRHQLNRYPDGLEKCIGCELCAWACPADAIYVEGASNTEDAQFSPGERYGRVYQINYLRCILCGLCIEACPTRALTMTNFYELAGPSRAGLIYEKHDLLAPMGSGMLAAPHPMAPGTDDTAYYRGEVTGVSPEQVEWVREHRPNDPTLPAASAAEGDSGDPS